MNGVDSSTATGRAARAAREGRAGRVGRRRERSPARTAAAVGCGGATVAGVTAVAVVLAAVVSAGNSCGAMFRAECERSGDELHRAAFRGDVETVRRDLAEGADPVGRDGEGTTPLSCAADGASTAVAVELVRAGADGRGLSATRQSQLFRPAVVHDDLETVNLLLDHGFDEHAAFAEPVMGAAVRANARRVLPELIRRGGDPQVALRAAITDVVPGPFPLFGPEPGADVVPSSAPLAQRLELTDLLLDQGVKPDRETLIAAASSLVDPGFMRRLLDHGGDPNGGDGAPLSYAASSGSAEVVRLLLAHGADPNRADSMPSALLWASLWANHDIVDQLLAAHADPNFGGHVSRTDADSAISLASRDQPAAATDYVTSAFAGFAAGGNVPPLVAAATWDHWDIAGPLLRAGADPNGRAGSLTPVMAASAYNHPVTLKLLLEAGATPTSPDPRIADPAVIAGQLGATEVVTLLRTPR